MKKLFLLTFGFFFFLSSFAFADTNTGEILLSNSLPPQENIETNTGSTSSGGTNENLLENSLIPSVSLFSFARSLSPMMLNQSLQTTNSLITHYPLNGDTTDITGNGYDGNANNITWQESGRGDGKQGAYFSGGASYIDLGLSTNLKPNLFSQKTISLWFKNGQYYPVYGLLWNGGYIINNAANSNGFIALHQDNKIVVTGNGTNVVVGNITHNDNTWHHIVVLFDASNTKLYFDGTLIASGPLNMNSNFSYVRSELGVSSYGTQAPIHYYNGFLQSVRVYESLLSDTQIQELYEQESQISLPTPTNLTQSIQSPLLEKEEVIPGEKVGKYQSGSGIIFEAQVTNPTQNQMRLAIKYSTGSTEHILYGDNFLTGTGQVILPYSGTGNYTWSARVENSDGTSPSSWVEYGSNPSTETDFTLYEGFEPYPYGYRFQNSSPVQSLLTGGIGTSGFPLYNRTIIPGYKWDVFYDAFDTSNLVSINTSNELFLDNKKLFDAFEARGLDKEYPNILKNGTCYGLALSATMKLSYSNYLQTNFSGIWDTIGSQDVWNVPNLGSSGSLGWDLETPFLKSLLSLHLSQYSFVGQKAQNDALAYTPLEVLDIIKANPGEPYLIGIVGTGSDDKEVGHMVVAYKAEGNRIYIQDSVIPYPNIIDDDGTPYFSYKQYITINSNTSLEAPFWETTQNWKGVKNILLIDMETISNNNQKSHVIGFNGNDITYSLSGNSNAYLIDSIGRISGYIGGSILREIPGVIVNYGFGATLSGTTDNTFKQIYLPQKQEGLTLKVEGRASENYTLMIAGGDYYNKVEGVSTNSGQVDTFQSTGTGLTINFDNSKTGKYNFLFDNFHNYGPQNTGTGTVYIDSIPTNVNLQSYSVDWTKVVQNTTDAVSYQVDTNNDGIIGNSGDTTTTVSPIFQDLTPPTTTATLSGITTPNSTTQTGSYYDQVQINLSSIDNQNGIGIDKTYYSLNTGSTLTYTGTITLTQTGSYILTYYSVDKFGNQETPQTRTFSIVQSPQQITPTYTFPTQTIGWNSGQQTAVSSWYTVVGNIPPYTWGQNIPFTTGGQGNPTVTTTNGSRASSGNFQGGLNILMNVPPRGESYTGYVYIGTNILAFTVKRDPLPPLDVGTLDFGTKTVNYGGTVTSNWVSFPFVPEATPFTLSGSGNPTVQISNGTRSNTGTVAWGTNIKADIPAVGQTRVIDFTIAGKTGKFTIIRQ